MQGFHLRHELTAVPHHVPADINLEKPYPLKADQQLYQKLLFEHLINYPTLCSV